MGSKIGIIGSGKVGSALGKWSASIGYEVAFTAKRMEHAQAAARESSSHGSDSARALAMGPLIESSEILLLTLPYGSVIEALMPFKPALTGRILVDVTNPLTADHRGLIIGRGDSGAETIQREFPEARVVKAFNHTFAEVYASMDARRDGHALSICYAGNDPSAKAQVAELIRGLGFDAVDAGPLTNSRFLEPLSLLNIHLGRELGYGTSVGFSFLRDR